VADHTVRVNGISYLRIGVNAPESVVVLGTSRGGTSFFASLVRCLGVHMGDSLGENHEAGDFHNCFYPSFDEDKFRAAVAHRKASTTGLWGFKLPKASLFADQFDSLLPAPVYILPFRNPASAALSEDMREGDFANSLRYSIHFFQKMEKFFRLSERPGMVSPYEKAVKEPIETLESIAALLHLEVTDVARAKALEVTSGDGGGYVSF
jgi:hypothetical protein